MKIDLPDIVKACTISSNDHQGITASVSLNIAKGISLHAVLKILMQRTIFKSQFQTNIKKVRNGKANGINE